MPIIAQVIPKKLMVLFFTLYVRKPISSIKSFNTEVTIEPYKHRRYSA